MKKKEKTSPKAKSILIIKQYEGGRAIDDLCRENGISKATGYNWKKRYSGMDGGQVRQLKGTG